VPTSPNGPEIIISPQRGPVIQTYRILEDIVGIAFALEIEAKYILIIKGCGNAVPCTKLNGSQGLEPVEIVGIIKNQAFQMIVHGDHF